jgi:hypothetical protein
MNCKLCNQVIDADRTSVQWPNHCVECIWKAYQHKHPTAKGLEIELKDTGTGRRWEVMGRPEPSIKFEWLVSKKGNPYCIARHLICTVFPSESKWKATHSGQDGSKGYKYVISERREADTEQDEEPLFSQRYYDRETDAQQAAEKRLTEILEA